MELRRPRLLVFLALILVIAAPAALASPTISVTVDATRTQQKLLSAHEVIPVKPGR